MRPASNQSLHGKRILVVEDQALVALDLQAMLEDDGAAVIGPFGGLAAALGAVSGQAIDAAILDVDLGEEDVLPLADRLVERGVPFVFHTGHAEIGRLRARYDGAPVVLKPAPPGEVIRRLAGAIASRGARP